VGEPINPSWEWYHAWSRRTLPIVDTWWQTETGGIYHAIAGATKLKPVRRPAFSLQAGMVVTRQILNGAASGNLVMSTVAGPDRTVYAIMSVRSDLFLGYKGMYFTGDGCRATRRRLLDHRQSR